MVDSPKRNIKNVKPTKEETVKIILDAIEKRMTNIENELITIQKTTLHKCSSIKTKAKGIRFSLVEEIDNAEIDERCKWIEERNFNVEERRIYSNAIFKLLKNTYKDKTNIIITPESSSNIPNAEELFT